MMGHGAAYILAGLPLKKRFLAHCVIPLSLAKRYPLRVAGKISTE